MSYSYILEFIMNLADGKVQISYRTALVLVAGYIVIFAGSFGYRSYLQAKIGIRMNYQFRKYVMQRFKTMTIQDYGRYSQEQYQTIVSQKADLLEANYFLIFPKAFGYTVSFIMAVIATFIMKPEIAVVIIILSLPAIIIPIIGKKKLESLQDDVLVKIDGYTTQFMDVFRGFSTITHLLSINRFIKKYDYANTGLADARTRNQKAVNIIDALNSFASDVLYLGTWICGAYFVIKHEITLGQLVAFSQLVNLVAWPLQNISELLANFYAGKRVINEVSNLFENISGDSYTQKNHLTKIDTIEFKNVSVSIEDRQILDNISFVLKTRERNVLIGKSGSGKSTIVKLLLKEVDYDGSILMDGVELSTISNQDVYSFFGIVNQQNIVFDGSIAENITMFSEEIQQKELTNAVAMAGLADKLNQLETQINNSNSKLSGGELRRLELARILYRKYNFTIFDEVTSGLDPSTALQVQADINRTNLGYLMITHDYGETFLQSTDHIIIINNGEVVHDGVTAEVIKYIE
nr:ABC transporter ATP-binding protein [Periweissella cryptocerci]